MRIIYAQILIMLYGASMMFIIGCLQPLAKTNSEGGQFNIDIGIKNVGEERINLAYVRFRDYIFRAGVVSPDSEAVHVDSGQSVPEQAEVGYRLLDGKDVVRTTSVKAQMPTNNADHIALNFVVDGEKPLRVEFLRFVQVDGKWTLTPL